MLKLNYIISILWILLISRGLILCIFFLPELTMASNRVLSSDEILDKLFSGEEQYFAEAIGGVIGGLDVQSDASAAETEY